MSTEDTLIVNIGNVKPDPIRLFHLLSLRGAVKLEKLGMRRHGKSAKSVAIEEFGLAKRAKHDEVIERINQEIRYWERLKEGELLQKQAET